ncbi:MAG: hypothetical protein DRJ61_17990 [Acidobacteria bacterium]|nr:MAG: hypothetical protein DRJ61_17990 [Acidobacteriota bacterium]
MARSPRLFIPGGIYHVYCRVARSERVFEDSAEARQFIDTVSDVKRLHIFTILAFCLMSTHYHLVIQTGEIPLWRTMARIQCRVARGFNKRHRFMGRLWQSRYKARLVCTQQYLEQLLAYVHLNPVAAGLVTDPSDFPWCDHDALLGRKAPHLCDVGASLRGFGESPAVARNAYLLRIRAVAEERWMRAGVRDLPWWSEVTNDELFAEAGDHAGAEDYSGRSVDSEPLEDTNLVQIAEHVCFGTSFTVLDLTGQSRSKELSAVRKEFASLAVDHYRHAVREVATFLGKHPGSVSRWIGTTVQPNRKVRLDATRVPGTEL